ncbi:MAG: CoA-binding protein [Bacteroidia bacterium]|nr:CoA-binding protein [Bacteroidia bacterium]
MEAIDTKNTLVMGASLKEERYSNLAIHMLRENNLPTLAFGLREGEVEGVAISKELESFENETIDTITLYLNPQRQEEYYDWLIARKPRRVIFNPGTENAAFMKMLEDNGIEVVIACTLVMLRTKQYGL